MNPQGMFRFYASLPFLILGAIIIVAIVKIILEKVTGKYGKSNKINRTIDISKCPIQTLETILDQCNNIHKAIRINSEMLFYIDEYNMYLIMFKNWIGNVQGEPKDLKWYIKSTQDYRVNNAYIVLKEKLNIVKFIIINDDIIPILLLNGLLIFNMSDPEIETIRMDNILDRINRKAYQKKYSEEQINEIAELLCKEMSKGLH